MFFTPSPTQTQPRLVKSTSLELLPQSPQSVAPPLLARSDSLGAAHWGLQTSRALGMLATSPMFLLEQKMAAVINSEVRTQKKAKAVAKKGAQ